MKLGILLAGRRPEDIAARLEQAREAGFSLCQLNLHQSGCSRADVLAVADRMEDLGIRPLAIGCYVNPLRPDDADFMGACRADLDLVLQCLDILGARRVVLWSGSRGATPFEPHEENGSAESVDALRSFLTGVVQQTRARHYFLVIEPWHGHVLSSAERVAAFHRSLEPAVAERVRYVLDAPGLMRPEQYGACANEAADICSALGGLTGLVHLRDCHAEKNGDPAICAPGAGALDYAEYVRAIEACVPADMGAIVRNVPPHEYAANRDYLLRLSDRWVLA